MARRALAVADQGVRGVVALSCIDDDVVLSLIVGTVLAVIVAFLWLTRGGS